MGNILFGNNEWSHDMVMKNRIRINNEEYIGISVDYGKWDIYIYKSGKSSNEPNTDGNPMP